MTHQKILFPLVGALVWMGGCVPPSTESVARSRNPCPTWGCGANSPFVDSIRGFHDLHLKGKPNTAGMFLHDPALSFKQKHLDLAIVNNRIVGQRDGVTVLQGEDLIGAEILLDTDEASPAYKIRIDRVREMDFPFGPPEKLEVYVFGWTKVAPPPAPATDAGAPDTATLPDAGAPDAITLTDAGTPDTTTLTDAGAPDATTLTDAGAPDATTLTDAGAIAAGEDAPGDSPPPTTTDVFSNLCSDPPYYLLKYGSPTDLHTPVFTELLGMDPDEALVFAGDRIDSARKEMSATADPLWFNIGCAGHALAKLHLTRNTLASAPPTPVIAPSHAMRQATLKLLVADYCGTGTPFTVAGQPLQWKGHIGEAKDSYFATPLVAGIEARWNENGATCLTEPRMAVSDLPRAQLEFPDVRPEIKAECGRRLPECEPDPNWLGHDLRVSANTFWFIPIIP